MAQNLVNLENVSVAYGTRHILEQVSLGVSAGQRIGVVGRNGGGKSTLLRVLARHEPPESGRVTHTGGLRVGLLGQGDNLDHGQTVHTAVLGDRAEYEWAADPSIRSVLDALLAEGSGVPLTASIGELSGGERRRVALAQLLIEDLVRLLLDEPTNHLDVEAVDWLTHHLATTRRALVVVSHDRWLLDTACEQMWEVGAGSVHAYDGGYSAYVLAKAERERRAAADEARRANLARKELAWLRRGPPARTSKPRFRVEAANVLIANEPAPRDPYELTKLATTRLGKQVLDLEGVSLQLGSRTLLDDVTWRLGPGDRVGLLGANGAGKTSLLRILTGSLQPDAGRVRTGKTVVTRQLSQEVADLDPGLRVLEAVEQVRAETVVAAGRTMTAGQLLDRFGFASARQWTPVRDISGGERRRLQLMRLLLDEPNVLLLDEPTNDLDVETLNVVEDLLDTWPGTVVVVSHDRWFLERVTDTVWALLGDGRLRDLPGGVEEYLRLRRSATSDAGGVADTVADTDTSAATRSQSGSASGHSAGQERSMRKEMARLERELDKLTRQEQALHTQMAEHATDADRMVELEHQRRELSTAREAAEERWLELGEALG